MSYNVSARSSVVRNAHEVCSEAVKDLSSAVSRLQQRYQQAGEKWKDTKYQQLGGIVQECSNALKKPIDELSACLGKLKELESVLLEYESTNL